MTEQGSGQAPRVSRLRAALDAVQQPNLSLGAALDRFAEGDELQPVIAWRAFTPASRRSYQNYLASNEGRDYAPDREREPDGTLSKQYPASMKPTYLAARACLQELASRLYAALNSGAWVLEYQPSDPAEPRKPEVALVWRFYRIIIRSDLVPIVVPTVRGMQPRVWRRASGHLAESVLFGPAPVAADPAAPAVAVKNVGGKPRILNWDDAIAGAAVRFATEPDPGRRGLQAEIAAFIVSYMADNDPAGGGGPSLSEAKKKADIVLVNLKRTRKGR